MRRRTCATLVAAGLACIGLSAAGPQPQAPKVQIPQPGVPQVMTIQGEYVRAAYNNEAYVIIGYRIAQQSVSEEWLMLEVGMTLRQGQKEYKLPRAGLSLETPDGKTVPLASNNDYLGANLMALQQRDKVMRDSINYFPPGATRACRLGYFSELGTRTMSYDDVEISPVSACVGRLFFQVPGGIKYGQHWLNVQFKGSLVRVPFRILTDDEQKTLSKHYDDIRKQVQEAFAPPKKK